MKSTIVPWNARLPTATNCRTLGRCALWLGGRWCLQRCKLVPFDESDSLAVDSLGSHCRKMPCGTSLQQSPVVRLRRYAIRRSSKNMFKY
ncbi:hypothetical protein M378DRAFT_130757, partial [Amanita muscaria Koide BX008]